MRYPDCPKIYSKRRTFEQENISQLRYLICPAPPANVKALQVEQNWEEWNCIFFLQNFFVYLPAADIGKIYCEASLKYRAGELFHRINVLVREITVLGVLNAGKGLFSKYIEVKRQREACQEYGINQCFSSQ